MCLLNLNCPPTGHEDATEDFGIYEFVSIPGKMESAQVERVPRFCTNRICMLELSLNFPVCLPPPAGVVQIPGPSRVGPGHAHHHL